MKRGLEPLGMGPLTTEYSEPTKYAGKSQNFQTLAFWQLDVYLWNYYLSFFTFGIITKPPTPSAEATHFGA